MNSKMTTNSRLSTTEPKQNKTKWKQTKETTRTGTDPQKQRGSTEMEGYQWIRGGGEWGKGTGNKKHKLQVQNRQRETKNSMGNEEAKELS